MLTRTGGEALVDGLLAHGIDTVFGLPGAQIYGLFDALERAQPRIDVIGARHEQTCGYMAFGYARATGRPAAFTVVPGPGLLNASAALLTAFGGNEPVLCLTGQVPTAFLDRGRGHLHEMPNQLATVSGFVKWARRVKSPGAVPAATARAFQTMVSGRRGPAAIEMPWDIFTTPGRVRSCQPLAPVPPPEPDAGDVDSAARLIHSSRAPMIFVGSGAMEAGEEVLEFAELIGAPVVAFRSGRGIVSNAHDLGLTMAAAYRLWPRTDLMIGIGTRLELPCWRWPYRPQGQRCIRIDIDPREMQRFTPDAGIVADAAHGTRALTEAVRRRGHKRRSRRQALRNATRRANLEIEAIQPQQAYLAELRRVLPDDGIVTDEISQVGFASWYAFPVYEPRTFISSGYQGTLGSGFPTALGVKAAHPERPVVALCGDGGFMFAVQELATAAQFELGVVVLLFNNNAFGNVRRDQQQLFDGRLICADLDNPDFMQLAEAFGVRGIRVRTPLQCRRALERAIADNKPCLIEVPVKRDSEANPWRFIHPAAHARARGKH